jgi:N-dimethylarginine dimethylaminohydrolase
MRRALMCPPDHYRVEYEINPWMSRARGVDPERAARQWRDLRGVLEGPLGIGVSLLDPAPGCPDLPFTANAGLADGNVFYPSRFRHAERRGEEPVFRAWFERERYAVRDLPGDAFFEGEGDMLRVGDDWFAGYRIRSDIRSHEAIGALIDRRVLSVELVDPHFYHLDTCFCPLADDAVAWYPEAFDPYARSVVEARVPRRIAVSREEAMRFACNAVVAGKRVVLNAGCGELKARLAEDGYEVFETDLSEFVKAGGSAKCLTLSLA